MSLNGLSSEEQVSCLNRWVSTVGKIEIQGKTLVCTYTASIGTYWDIIFVDCNNKQH